MAALILGLPSCRSAPISGRKQLLLVPETQEVELGLKAYRETLAAETLSTDPKYVDLVRRVGNQIAQAAQRPDYQWEFNLIASPQQNAFCLPGGKVAVHEGILPICQNEAGLAVVMSHEIAHALARHGGERMSQGFVVNGAGIALGYLTKGQEAAQREQMMRVFGVTSKYGFVLPYSRKHESEADRIGIILMARAGYDPSEAPRFWQRFSGASGGTTLPEFLSTHPADARRAQELLAQLPAALAEYERAPTRLGLGVSFAGATLAETAPHVQSPIGGPMGATATATEVAADPYAVPPQRSLLR
ncbi:MAG TPA: M48 family metallopeptidase [Pirellulaceae bacterium]